jgi:hypothetical protein
MSDRPKVFEGIDWANGRDRGYHVVTIGPDATPEDVQAFRDAYELGCAWADAKAAKPEGWMGTSLAEQTEGNWRAYSSRRHSGPRDERHFEIVTAVGPTPAAALRALAERLRERTG